MAGAISDLDRFDESMYGGEVVSVSVTGSSALQLNLNRLAGTSGLSETGAANAWAGTAGLALVGALNAQNGTVGLDLQGVLNDLAGTSGLAVVAAAEAIVA